MALLIATKLSTLSQNRLSIPAIAEHFEVSQKTLMSSYKEVKPMLEFIVPDTWVKNRLPVSALKD